MMRESLIIQPLNFWAKTFQKAGGGRVSESLYSGNNQVGEAAWYAEVLKHAPIRASHPNAALYHV